MHQVAKAYSRLPSEIMALDERSWTICLHTFRAGVEEEYKTAQELHNRSNVWGR